ncbi:MAG: putative metal-binding motif-containing protein [Myxococcota bacterium]
MKDLLCALLSWCANIILILIILGICSTMAQARENDQAIYYLDADGDGFGSARYPIRSFFPHTVTGLVLNAFDCNDQDPLIAPGRAEVIDDDVDNDCDGERDEPPSAYAFTYFADADGDGFGSIQTGWIRSQMPLLSSTLRAQFSASPLLDCDDNDASINPGTLEVTGDGIDNNCDGVGENIGPQILSIWFADADGDGFGDQNRAILSKERPIGGVSNALDCDDQNLNVYPGALEIFGDGIDSDCNQLNEFDRDGDRFESYEFGGDDLGDNDSRSGSRTALIESTQQVGKR